jgi:hypothetical protein
MEESFIGDWYHKITLGKRTVHSLREEQPGPDWVRAIPLVNEPYQRYDPENECFIIADKNSIERTRENIELIQIKLDELDTKSIRAIRSIISNDVPDENDINILKEYEEQAVELREIKGNYSGQL